MPETTKSAILLDELSSINIFNTIENLILNRNKLKLCQKLKIDTLFVGKEFYRINKKAFQNLNELQKFIKEKPIKNKTILLKGSRSVNLEELVSYL